MHGIPTLPHIYYGLISWYKHIRFIRISYLYFDHTRQLIDFIVQNETEMGVILYMHAWIMHTQQAYYIMCGLHAYHNQPLHLPHSHFTHDSNYYPFKL